MAKIKVPTLTIVTIHQRSKGRCELDGLACNNGRHVHHRQPRGMGSSTGDPHAPENLLVLHANCHLVRIERNRTEAYFYGWLVRHGREPAQVPVFTHRGWVRLSGGEYLPCTEAESELLRRDGADGPAW